jgi:hypothetical protein
MHMPEERHREACKNKSQPALFCTSLERAELRLREEPKTAEPAAHSRSHPSFEVKKGARMYAFPRACWKTVYVKQCACQFF